MAAQRAVKAGQAPHLKNLTDAIALFPDRPAASIVKLNLATGVRAVT